MPDFPQVCFHFCIFKLASVFSSVRWGSHGPYPVGSCFGGKLKLVTLSVPTQRQGCSVVNSEALTRGWMSGRSAYLDGHAQSCLPALPSDHLPGGSWPGLSLAFVGQRLLSREPGEGEETLSNLSERKPCFQGLCVGLWSSNVS